MAGDSRTALGSIFGAIISLFTSLTKLFKAADRGIDMLDRYAQDAQENQVIRSAADKQRYAKEYLRRAAISFDESRKTVEEYRNRSQAHADGYDAAFAELAEAVNKRLEEYRNTRTEENNLLP